MTDVSSGGDDAWGGSTELTPMETLMWRADVDPSMRSTVTGIELLDREPDWERLVDAVAWAGRMVPRFRDKVSDPLAPLGTPTWVPDGDLDVRYHLRRVRLPDGVGPAGLLELAGQLAMTPFDRARPPWEAVVVTGLPDGRAAFVIKVHHALSDGLGLTQLLGLLHARQREHDPDKPEPRPTSSEPGAGGPGGPAGVAGHVARQVRRDVGALAPALGAGAARAVRGLRRPRGSARDAGEYLDSARRVLSPPGVGGLPLLARRGTSWRFVALDLALADFRAAAKVAGGTVNDAYLAALMGAFRTYHERSGAPLGPDALMPVTAPVSVRREGDAGGGNRFAPARVSGPVGDPDPVRRVQALGAAMRAARAEPALESVGLVAPLLARLPTPVIVRLGSGALASSDLQASNVPGLREEVFIAGARIDRLYGFAPLPGCAAMITMASHGDVLCVGANLDAAAITDVPLFAACLVAGFTEVLALHEGSAPPRLLA